MSAAPGSQTVAAGGSTTFIVTVTALNAIGGPVSLNVSSVPGLSAEFSSLPVTVPGSATLVVSAASASALGTSQLTITGTNLSGSQSITVSVTVTAPAAFSLAASPNSQLVFLGHSVNYSIQASAVRGPMGAVSLSVMGTPQGAIATFNPPVVSSSSPQSTLTISTTALTIVGDFDLTISGADNTGNNSVTVKLGVQVSDFFLFTAPKSLVTNAGGTANYTVQALPAGPSADNLNLEAIAPPGTTATFNPPSISGASGTSTLAIAIDKSAAAGTSSILIKGTDSNSSNSEVVTLAIQAGNPTADFFLSATPTFAEPTAGNNVTYTVKVGMLGGSTATVNLSVSGLPGGSSASFTPPSVSGGSGVSTLTIATDINQKFSFSTLTITGIDSTGSQSVNVNLQVDPAPPP